MRSLLIFFFRYRAFITFLVLEFICATLIIQNTSYQKALFFNSSNSLIGGILNLSNDVATFINLEEVNQQLSAENANLKQQIAAYNSDSASGPMADSSYQFIFRTAQVIDNSVNLRNNTLTIRIGSEQGIQPGMGVVGGGGVVGKVRYVSDKYAVVTSLLNSDGLLSAQVKDKVALCTISWDWGNPTEVKLLYVPRQYSIQAGDSVLTSGYNAVFPAGILVGMVSNDFLPEDAPFHDITVKLANDFMRLSHVDVIENRFKTEIDSLTNITVDE